MHTLQSNIPATVLPNQRIDFITVQVVYKCLYKEMPEPLQKMFTVRNTQRLKTL